MDIGDVSFVDVEQTDERKARRKRLAPDNIKVVNTVKKKKVAVNVSAKKQKVVNEDTQETSTQGVTRTIKRKVKGVLKEVQVKKGIKKKKKKVTLIDFTTFDIQTKSSYIKITKDYIMFSPYGKDIDCDVVGVDIGIIRLGIVGIKKFPGETHPRWVWACLLNIPTKATHFSCDIIDELISTDPNFSWARNAPKHRIELQVQFNHIARQMAQGIRTCFRVNVMNDDKDPDVQFVHGDKKYSVGPKYCPETRNDPLRSDASGSKNTKKRKILGSNDVRALLKMSGKEGRMDRFLDAILKHNVDEFDLDDAYLIARCGYDEN